MTSNIATIDLSSSMTRLVAVILILKSSLERPYTYLSAIMIDSETP